jgi:hypothetical protein
LNESCMCFSSLTFFFTIFCLSHLPSFGKLHNIFWETKYDFLWLWCFCKFIQFLRNVRLKFRVPGCLIYSYQCLVKFEILCVGLVLWLWTVSILALCQLVCSICGMENFVFVFDVTTRRRNWVVVKMLSSGMWYWIVWQ